MKGKKRLALLICIAVATLSVIQIIANLYYKRTRYIEPVIFNIYEFNFQSHWKQVAEVLDLNEISVETARVEDLNIDYDKTGEIKRLRYEVKWREKEQFRHASVYFDEGQKKLKVKAIKVSEYMQYDRIIDADRLFEKLDEINLKDLTSQEDFPYYGLMYAGRVNLGVTNEEVFIIEDNRIVPFKGVLPVKGYWIKTFGMAQTQTGVNSYSSMHGKNYLFDVQY